MWTAIGAFIGTIGTAIGGIFGMKKEQATVVNSTVDLLGKSSDIDTQAVAAAGKIIAAEANSSSWLAANWRPLFMIMFGAMIVGRWFGHEPPNMSKEELARVYDLFEIGLMGYIGSRGIEKVITSLGIQKTLRTFIEKKLL